MSKCQIDHQIFYTNRPIYQMTLLKQSVKCYLKPVGTCLGVPLARNLRYASILKSFVLREGEASKTRAINPSPHGYRIYNGRII
jgi:hypothetical protein